MASSELPPGISARALRTADLAAALALSREAGWNQVAADWEVFLDLGGAVALTAPGGEVIATAATLPHGARFGWIGMVLVTAAQRRRGLAGWLLADAVARLTAQGLTPGLDATPAGRPVYLRLGFHDCWEIDRLVRAGDGPAAPPPTPHGIVVRRLAATDWPALLAYDQAVFGGTREELLRRLATRLPTVALVAERNGELAGFAMGRSGRVMTQIGPLQADDEEVARALLAHGLAVVRGPVAVDLARRHGALAAWLAAQGFTAERPLTRMVHNRHAAFDDAARLFAIAGPELG